MRKSKLSESQSVAIPKEGKQVCRSVVSSQAWNQPRDVLPLEVEIRGGGSGGAAEVA